MTVLECIEADAMEATGERRDILLRLAWIGRRLSREVSRMSQKTGLDFCAACDAVRATAEGANLNAQWWFLYAAAYPDSAPLYPDKYAQAGAACAFRRIC